MEKLEIYQMLKLLYPFGRPYIESAVNDPDAMWDDHLMTALDDLMGMSDDDASKAMVILEWNYAMFLRGILESKVPENVLAELDKFMDYQA